MDFTFTTYENLLNTLLSRGFSFMTFAQYIEAKFHTERSRSASNPLVPRAQRFGALVPRAQRFGIESLNLESLNLESLNFIILRHDVEARYPNALRMAQIQHKHGISGTYYFRIFPKPGNEAIIKQIAALGHEIGYHYDDLSYCKGDYKKAIARFQQNLAFLREIAPVQTICMEGAPGSKYNNQDLWKTYSYHDFGITSEPYFDLNFNTVYYLTDTGRRWDGKFSVRDKAVFRDENVRGEMVKGELVRGELVRSEFKALRFRHTKDIIKAVKEGSFPNQAMLNFHPQRWNDKLVPWLKEFVWQNVKNQGKRFLVKKI